MAESTLISDLIEEEAELTADPLEVISRLQEAKGEEQRKPLYKEFERVPLGARYSARRKTTEEGVLSNLEARYGKGNVFSVGDDNFAVVKRDETGNVIGKPMLLEEAGSALEEFGADIWEILPEVGAAAVTGIAGAGGAILGGPAGGVAGLALGGAGTQEYLEQLAAREPGEDRPKEGVLKKTGRRLSETAMQTSLDLLGGKVLGAAGKTLKRGVAEAAGGVGKRLPTAVTPGTTTRMLKGAEKEAIRTPEEAAELTFEAGVKPDLAEATLAPRAITKRAALHTQHKEAAAKELTEKLVTINKTLSQELDKIGKATAPEARGRLADAAMLQVKMADAKVQKAFQPRIDETFRMAREEILDETATVGNMRHGKAAVDRLLAKYTEKPPILVSLRELMEKGFTTSDFQNQLSRFGKPVNVVPGEAGINKGITKQIFKAFVKDLGEAAEGLEEQLTGRAPKQAIRIASKMLLEARNLHRQKKEALEGFADSTLEAIIKRAAPKTALSELSPKTLTKSDELGKTLAGKTVDDKAVANVLDTLRRFNPELASRQTRVALEDVLSGAIDTAPSKAGQLAGGKLYHPIKLWKTLSDPAKESRLIALSGGRNTSMFRTLKAIANFGEMAGAAAREEKALLGGKSSTDDMARLAILALSGQGVAGDPSGAAAAILAERVGSKLLSRFFNRSSVLSIMQDPGRVKMLEALTQKKLRENPYLQASLVRELLAGLPETLEGETDE
jgi:hypothetical protein